MGKFQGAAQEKGQGRVYGLSATTRSKFAQCHLLQEESVMESQALAVYCTCPDQVVAERIAEAVVSERLAACVNLVPDVTSIYRWQGEIQRDAELLLIIKTRRTVYRNWKPGSLNCIRIRSRKSLLCRFRPDRRLIWPGLPTIREVWNEEL